MRSLVAIIILTFSLPLLAADGCFGYFNGNIMPSRARAQRSEKPQEQKTEPNPKAQKALEAAHQEEAAFKTKISELEDRLAKHFGKDWQTTDHQADANSARYVLDGLKETGSFLDLQIFDTYLRIFESTTGRYIVRKPGFYLDKWADSRPKSPHFQERHWDWMILEGYFFNSPSQLSFTKEADLAYLQDILRTAERFGGRASLKKVLQEGNVSWDLRDLQKHPEVARGFEEFSAGKSYNQLFTDLLTKVSDWTKEPRQTEKKQARWNLVKEPLAAFKSSNSKFDLFIFDKYFDLARRLQNTAYHPPDKEVRNRQLTDDDVFYNGLPSGSFEFLMDFLFQNSHDTAMKSHLVLILDEMNRRVDADPSETQTKLSDGSKKKIVGPFYYHFMEARATVDQSLPDIPPPELYQTDLDIISLNGAKSFGTNGLRISVPAVSQVRVSWNPKMGRLQANVVGHARMRDGKVATVRDFPSLALHLKNYFDAFRSEGKMSPQQIDAWEERELNIPITRTTFLFFSDPKTRKVVAMTRVFDGSHLEFQDPALTARHNKGDEATLIERDYNNVNFPERRLGLPVYEIGRVRTTPFVAANSLSGIMARVADYFRNTGARGTVYFDGDNVTTAHHRSKFGVDIAYTPDQLLHRENDRPLWIMRMTVPQFIHQFVTSTYESLRPRAQTPPKP